VTPSRFSRHFFRAATKASRELSAMRPGDGRYFLAAPSYQYALVSRPSAFDVRSTVASRTPSTSPEATRNEKLTFSSGPSGPSAPPQLGGPPVSSPRKPARRPSMCFFIAAVIASAPGTSG
jgi:hypothetical protein